MSLSDRPVRSPSADTIPLPLAELRAMLGADVEHASIAPPAPALRCPECLGFASDPMCSTCSGAGSVDAEAFARHHARGQGRP